MIRYEDSSASAPPALAIDPDTPAQSDTDAVIVADDSRSAGQRLAERFVQDVFTDWAAHGAAAIATVRQERPHEFLKLVTGLLPKEADAKEDRLDALTDEQLSGALAAVLARLAAAGAGPGNDS